jgi:hypothetical protein
VARAAVDTAPKDPASHLTRLKEGYVLGKRYVRHHHNQRGTTWTTETLPKNGLSIIVGCTAAFSALF